MKTPFIGQEVILNTLLQLGDFKGIITEINPFGRGFIYDKQTVNIKLDKQDKSVGSVLYFDEEPEGEILSNLWQICYPIKEKKL